jgi:hypothetical protein
MLSWLNFEKPWKRRAVILFGGTSWLLALN